MAIFSINNIQKIVPTSISSNQRSVVYFTRDISPLGLIKIYQALGVNLKPNIAVKISTGERSRKSSLSSAFSYWSFNSLF